MQMAKIPKKLEKVCQEVWEELISQSRYHLFKTCWKNDQVQLHVNFSKKFWTLPKSNVHIFIVFITVQLCRVWRMFLSLKVWEELFTRSRYTILRCPPGIRHISQMHFLLPDQKLVGGEGKGGSSPLNLPLMKFCTCDLWFS
jgi:hypothetical protein